MPELGRTLRLIDVILRARSIRQYLGTLESKLELESGIGWERQSHRSSSKLTTAMSFAFWLVLQITTFAVAHYVPSHR